MRVDKAIARTNVAAAQRRPAAAAASSYVLCALRQSCQGCPTTPPGGQLQVVPRLLHAACIRHVDVYWFLAQSMFSFARGNCGLSWPTTFIIVRFETQNIKQTQSQTHWKNWVHLGHFGSCLFGSCIIFGIGEIEIGQIQPKIGQRKHRTTSDVGHPQLRSHAEPRDGERCAQMEKHCTASSF